MGSERERGTVVAQGFIRGNDFTRTVVSDGENGLMIAQKRAKMAMIGANIDTGDAVYVDLDHTPVPAQDVPKITFIEARELDNVAVQGPQLSTIEKSALSKPVINLDEDILARGGNPNAQIPKRSGSFSLGIHPSQAGRKAS
ncbi:hypothetical protein C4564_05900 [Candidatus Microgenomates bacterium]|nr:MAG: hypothetical protein C4564_05900 [Candidatus Microgenomates bacterium]